MPNASTMTLSQLAARRVDALSAIADRFSRLPIGSEVSPRLWGRRQASIAALARAERVDFERAKEVEFLTFQEEATSLQAVFA